MSNTSPVAGGAAPVGNPNLMPRPNFRNGRAIVQLPATSVVPKAADTAKPADVVKADAKPADAAKPAEPVKEEYLIDGEKVMLTAEEARAEVQKSRSSQKRFEEAAKKQQDAEDGLKAILANPLDGFKKIGGDPVKMFQELLAAAEQDKARKIEWDKLTPEQQEARTLKEENTKLKAERDSHVKQQSETQAAQKREASEQKVASSVQAVCEQMGLPKTKDGMLEAGEIIKAFATTKGEEKAVDQIIAGTFPLEKLFAKAKERAVKRMKWMSGGFDVTKLVAMLPPEVIQAIKDHK